MDRIIAFIGLFFGRAGANIVPRKQTIGPSHASVISLGRQQHSEGQSEYFKTQGPSNASSDGSGPLDGPSSKQDTHRGADGINDGHSVNGRVGGTEIFQSAKVSTQCDDMDRRPTNRDVCQDKGVFMEYNGMSSLRQEIDRMHHELVEAKSQAEGWKTKEQAGRDQLHQIEVHRNDMRLRLEAAENALENKDALLEKFRRECEAFAARAGDEKATLEEAVRQRDYEVRASHAELDVLKSHLESSKKLLDIRTRELNGAKPFLTKADSFSGADVIALVQSLNADIFQLSAFMADSFPMADNTPSKGEDYTLLHEKVERYLGTRLKDAIMFSTHKEDPTVLQIALQCYIVRFSWNTITRWTFKSSLLDIAVLYKWVRDQGEDVRSRGRGPA